MKKQTIFKILLVVVVVVAIAFMIYFISWLQGESWSCMKDPINYYANKTAQMCYCNDGLGWVRG